MAQSNVEIQRNSFKFLDILQYCVDAIALQLAHGLPCFVFSVKCLSPLPLALSVLTERLAS